MSEVENHYAGGAEGEDRKPGRSAPREKTATAEKPTGAKAVAKAAIDQASSSARSTLKAAQDAAGGVRASAADAVGGASEWATSSYEKASKTVGDARRSSAQQFHEQRRTVTSFIEENPIMVGVVGLAAGLLVGALLPGTRRENKAFGRYADEVRDQGVRYARELAEQGRTFVQETLDPHADEDKADGQRAAT